MKEFNNKLMDIKIDIHSGDKSIDEAFECSIMGFLYALNYFESIDKFIEFNKRVRKLVVELHDELTEDVH